MSKELDLIPYGVLGRPHGLSGEMTLRPFNDDAAELADAPLVVRLRQGSATRDITVTAWRPAGDALLVRLEGVESRELAAALTNAEIWVPRASLPPLGEGEIYIEDMVGCEVVDGEGRVRGTVRGTFWNGAHEVLTVEGPDGAEWLVPAVPDFIRAVDSSGRRLVVDPHE